MKLGLRAANQQFSKAIKAVRAGKDVVLTERGQPFAVISRIRAGAGDCAAVQAMADEGLVRLAARTGPLPAPRWRPVEITGPSLAETIVDGREESD